MSRTIPNRLHIIYQPSGSVLLTRFPKYFTVFIFQEGLGHARYLSKIIRAKKVIELNFISCCAPDSRIRQAIKNKANTMTYLLPIQPFRKEISIMKYFENMDLSIYNLATWKTLMKIQNFKKIVIDNMPIQDQAILKQQKGFKFSPKNHPNLMSRFHNSLKRAKLLERIELRGYLTEGYVEMLKTLYSC